METNLEALAVLVMVLAVLTSIPRTNHHKVGLNMTLILKLTLEEIHNGVTKKFKYKRNDTCKTCHGHGAMDITNCEVCNGNGVINRIMQTPIGVIQQSFPCHNCHGVGSTFVNNCLDCNGTGSKY
jgi:molecular chaperone DnaJ